MNVGVGVFARIAKPFDVNTGSEQGGRHAALRIEFILFPPIITVIKDDIHIHASVLCVDHRFHQMHLLQQIHVDVQRRGGAVDPGQEIGQAVFWSDEGRDGAAGGGGGVKAEGAAAKAAPLFMPVGHGVGVRCVPAATASEVNQIVKVGQRFCQSDTTPS